MTDKKKRLHWMPWDVPAYLADTTSFNAEQHGAYLMLLASMWMERGPLLANDEDLAQAARCTPERWQAIKHKVLAKFELADGKLSQGRLLEELGKASKVSAARREAGLAGAAAKHGKPAAKKVAKGVANAKQNDGQKQEHKHSPNGESSGASDDPPKETKAKPVKGEYSEDFEAAWALYPKRAGGNSKADAYKAWCARVKAGATIEELTSGTQRYADYCEAESKVGSSFVKQAATFYGPGFHFLEAWTPAPRAAANTNRHDVRSATMSGLGSKQGQQHGTDRPDSSEPIDVQARVIPDAG